MAVARRPRLAILISTAVALNVVLAGGVVDIDGFRLAPQAVRAGVTCGDTHVPTTLHAWGHMDLPAPAIGVKARIQAVPDPVICDVTGDDNKRFTTENVTICTTTNCQGWVQVGWIWEQSWSLPKYFCEFAPSNGNPE